MKKQLPSAEIEKRARAILGLEDLERQPYALPVRVEHLWRAENFAPSVPHTASLLLPFGRAPDIRRLGQSIVEIVARHEALRSRLAVEKGRATLVPQNALLEELSLVRASQADIAAYQEKIPGSPLTSFFTTPINLFDQTGFRCRAFEDEEGNVFLGILMHHYFGDAWSSQILRREIEAVYEAGSSAALAPVTQYSGYALFQRRTLEKNLDRYLSYWHQRLKDAQASEMPFDQPGDDNFLGRAYFLIENDVMGRLTEIARQERVALGVICFSGFQLALAKWCGVREMVSATQSADRIRPQFRGTVGYLLSAIAIHSRLRKDMPFRQFLLEFAREVYDGIAHQELPCELYDEIFCPPQPFCAPRFTFVPRQESFFVGDTEGAPPAINGIFRASDVRKISVYRDLHLLVLEYREALLCRVVYNKELSFDKIASLAETYRQVLETVSIDPNVSLGAFL